MTSVRALSLPLFLATCLAVAGCNKANKNHLERLANGTASAPVTSGVPTFGVTGTPGSAAAPSPAPAPVSAPLPISVSPVLANVGSPFWHENDSFGNPLKAHSAAEDSMARQVLLLVNAERANQGLRALLSDAEAERAAKVHSEDMEGRGFFDHFTPEGWSPGDRLQMTGASGYTMAGENVAFGQQTPDEVVRAWMNSPGHRANILNPDFTHIGVGVADGRPYWTQVFLRR